MKLHENGLTTARMTMAMTSTNGTSFMIRQSG